MPELPEVETIAADLRPVLKGLSFLNMIIQNRNSVIFSRKNLTEAKNKKVLNIIRRGKFINIFLENNFVITIHLRMTGRLIIRGISEPELPYERARLIFDDKSLRFCDLRKFGRIWLNKKNNYIQNTGIYKLGVEPLGNEFENDFLQKILQKKRGNIKSFLLNQAYIAGIGNIYADESLFLAGVRPERKTESLTDKETGRLYQGIKKSLRQGIENRGTSISDFQDAYGKKGMNQEILYVYGRKGKDCLKCQSKLIKIKTAGRGTVYCPTCQK